MHGNNPIRKPKKGDGSTLDVQAIFKTFQGEGPYAGWPAIFIRLGGCNLACDFCDTEFESFKSNKLESIVKEVDKLSGREETDFIGELEGWTHKLVVITGGEPFRQPIEMLCTALLTLGYRVQLETNGTLYRPVDDMVSIVCSPKVTKGSYHPLREDLLQRVDALKFIVSASKNHKEYADVPDVGQVKHHVAVYVQPMDEDNAKKNAANLKRTVKVSQEKGYRLSLQLHKIAGVE